jgi:hypothetical protein
MIGLFKHILPLVIVLPLLVQMASVGAACPFCGMQGPTLTGEVGQSKLVLYGQLVNAKEEANGDGTTDLLVANVIKNDFAGKKDDPLADKNKTVRLDRYIPGLGANNKYRYLVYCDIFRGKVDPYRTVPVDPEGGMPKYLLGALQLKDESIGKKLRYFFDYLDNPDTEISNDAFKEFANADYKDYQGMAKDLPAERVVGWLKNDTRAFRYGLYSSLLGHCGKPEHAVVLREMLDDPAKRLGSGVDGMLAGYIMLKPKEGWSYARDILKDEKKEFMTRYAALRAVRFLWDLRPDLVPRKDLKEGINFLLDQNDIADLAIDDLRKRQCWDMTDRVLGLRNSKAYEIPIVRRALLRFALNCQDSKSKSSAAARAYVDEMRKKDAQMVADAEELLKLEETPPTTTKPAK